MWHCHQHRAPTFHHLVMISQVAHGLIRSSGVIAARGSWKVIVVQHAGIAQRAAASQVSRWGRELPLGSCASMTISFNSGTTMMATLSRSIRSMLLVHVDHSGNIVGAWYVDVVFKYSVPPRSFVFVLLSWRHSVDWLVLVRLVSSGLKYNQCITSRSTMISVKSANHDLLFLWGRLTMICHFCEVGSPWFVISVRSDHHDLSFLWGRLTMIKYFVISVRSAHHDLSFLWGRLTMIYYLCEVG